MSLRDFINSTRSVTTPPRRLRTDWGERDMSIALDLRLTAADAAQRIGCHAETVKRERRQWSFEWK